MVFIVRTTRASLKDHQRGGYIKGRGFQSGGAGWFDSLWPTLKTVGKWALPVALPFLANWLFNRNKTPDASSDPQKGLPPSQQMMNWVQNQRDRYGQFIPDELDSKLDTVLEDPRLQQLATMVDKKPLPSKAKPTKKKPEPVRVVDAEDLEPAVTGEGIRKMSLHSKNKLKKIVKGSGLMMFN